jgi:hypothetical protein
VGTLSSRGCSALGLLFPESAPVAERDAAQSTVHDSTMSPNLAVQQPVKLRENARLMGDFFHDYEETTFGTSARETTGSNETRVRDLRDRRTG